MPGSKLSPVLLTILPPIKPPTRPTTNDAVIKSVLPSHKAAGSGRGERGPLEGERFERFIEDLFTSFARAPVSEISSEIDRWIKQIVLSNGLDWGALAQIDPKSGKLIIRHSWSRDETLSFSGVSEFVFKFAQGGATLRRDSRKSNVTVPVSIRGETVGAVGFAALRSERRWPPRAIRRLELVAKIFGTALERRRSAGENDHLRQEFAHLSRMSAMGELTASLAHQLNQPMAAILSNAEAIQSMLESRQPDLQEIREAIGEIVQDDQRAADIIKGVRALFQKDSMQKVSLDLGEVVGEVICMVRSEALFRNVSLTFEAPSSRLRIFGDRTQLQQVIINLLLNAFEAVSDTNDAREVTARIIEDGDRVILVVRDSGRGIEPNLALRIFDPFFTTKRGGMGMGLYHSSIDRDDPRRRALSSSQF